MAYRPRLSTLLPSRHTSTEAPSTSSLPVRAVRPVRDVPDLTVSEFARGNQMYELQVPYMDETLWFVPDVRIPAQAEHRFRAKVNTCSGMVNTDSGHGERSFRAR